MNQLKPFFLYRLIVDRWKDRVKDQLHHFVDHLRKQILDESIRGPKVRIVVDLQQPYSEVFVHQEIIPEELELFLFPTSPEKFLNKNSSYSGTHHGVNDKLFYSANSFLQDSLPSSFSFRQCL